MRSTMREPRQTNRPSISFPRPRTWGEGLNREGLNRETDNGEHNTADEARTTRKKRRNFVSRLKNSIIGAPHIDFPDEEAQDPHGQPSMTMGARQQKRISFSPTLLKLSESGSQHPELVDFTTGRELNEDGGEHEPQKKRLSTTRRTNVNKTELTMGLSDLSADFLDFALKARGQDWLKSLSLRDPRFCIKAFFDDVAMDGCNKIEEGTFHPELLSPLMKYFQRSSVFSVWRPTSIVSIEKMMRGHGVGKGLDIKGKSAKKGKLSAFIPFLQIHEEEHKKKIRNLPSGGRIRIFYKKEVARDRAYGILTGVLNEMLEKVAVAEKAAEEKRQALRDSELSVFGDFRSTKQILDNEEEKNLKSIKYLKMDDPSIEKINNYSPKCFGLEMPKRLFWEGYVMRAKDISRHPGSDFETGRPSIPGFQDMNFGSIKDKFDPDSPRAVVWQYTDPYQPPDQPDPDPMLPQTLLVAYEENGRVLPVVSDFDCFLLGTRGIRYQTPLPEEQVNLVHEVIDDTEKILQDCSEGKSTSWTASWLANMKQKTGYRTMPKYGFGDPKSYQIMRHAVKRLEEFGAVRHGAECFNYIFPQDLDEDYLVIGGNLEGAKYKYMKLHELQAFLSDCIDNGFTFPLNPKWVLCDAGWKSIWDKLLASTHHNVESSINVWYPPESGIRERIEAVHTKYPQGYYPFGERKSDGGEKYDDDEAEFALDRHRRIGRAKRKLLIVLTWISIVQQSQKKVQKKNARLSALKKALTKVSIDETSISKVGEDAPKSEESVAVLLDTSGKGESALSSNGQNEIRRPQRHTVYYAGGSSQELSDASSNDGRNDAAIIKSMLTDESLKFTISQSKALRRVIDMLDRTQPQLTVEQRSVIRRHTSIGLSRDIGQVDEAPQFILKEYGIAEMLEKRPRATLKSAAGAIIAAGRLIAKCKAESSLEFEFLPQEWQRLSKEQKKNLAGKLSFKSLSRWDFNVFDVDKDCNGSPLLLIGWALLGSPHAQRSMAKDIGLETEESSLLVGYDFVRKFQVKPPVLCNFLRTTDFDYLPNPYHNSLHAADVLVSLHSLLENGGKAFAASDLHIFSLLIAAVIHDVKHPGLNNNFQINSHSDVAVRYNDVSVLENMSVAWLFSQVIGKNCSSSIDIFSGLNLNQFSIARSIIIKTVLGTDMSHHFLMMATMARHIEHFHAQDNKDWFTPYTHHGNTYNGSLDVLCFLLHLADISNPAKPHPMFLLWADRVLAEFYAQGDKEASLSLPISPLCDRATTGKKQSQIGFIKFVVQPAFELLGDIIPQLNEIVNPCVEESLQFWEEYEEDANGDEANGAEEKNTVAEEINREESWRGDSEEED